MYIAPSVGISKFRGLIYNITRANQADSSVDPAYQALISARTFTKYEREKAVDKESGGMDTIPSAGNIIQFRLLQREFIPTR